LKYKKFYLESCDQKIEVGYRQSTDFSRIR